MREKKSQSKKGAKVSTPSEKSNDISRSQFILDVFEAFVDKNDTVLEIGAGTWRHVDYLNKHGYNVVGIDKNNGTAIEDVEPKKYDVIYTASTLFLIPPENNWVFEKIAGMAQKFIITFEGETTDIRRNVWGRNYKEIFEPFGFVEIDTQEKMFNEYGVLRVLKRI